jgi:hypothetical protein
MKIPLTTLLDQASKSLTTRTTIDITGARRVHTTGQLRNVGGGFFHIENRATCFAVKFHESTVESVNLGLNSLTIKLRRSVK